MTKLLEIQLALFAQKQKVLENQGKYKKYKLLFLVVTI